MANLRVGRRSGLVLRGGRQRRETRWLDGPFTSSLLTGASAPGILLSLTAAELALRPFTVVRVRGKFAIRSDQLAATEDYSGALGYAVVSD